MVDLWKPDVTGNPWDTLAVRRLTSKIDRLSRKADRLEEALIRIAEMDITINGAARYMVAIATAAIDQEEAKDE